MEFLYLPMENFINTVAAIGWVIVAMLGIQNHNLRREIKELKESEKERSRENRIKHEKYEFVLRGMGDMLAENVSILNAKEKVAEIWRKAEERAEESLKNESDLEP